jgi:hypothetical protein
MRWFGGPNKRLRNKRRADKLYQSNGVGMSEANDLANRNPEPPTGGGAYTGLLCEAWNALEQIIASLVVPSNKKPATKRPAMEGGAGIILTY